MKKLTIISSSILCATMLASSVMTTGCNRKELVVPVDPTQTELTFTAGIDKVDVAQTLASGIRNTEFQTNDQIGLYVVAYLKPDEPGRLETSGNYVDNAKSTKGSSNWKNTPAIYYPSVDVDLYAYAPYNAVFDPTTTPNSYKFTVADNQSGANEVVKYDFMTAQVVKQSTTTSTIPMTFYHRLSKLDVKFTVPSTFKDKTISGVKAIKFRNFKSGAIIDLTTRYTYTLEGAATGGSYPKPATFDPKSASIDITPNLVNAGTLGSITDLAQYEAIVVPQTQLSDVDFIEIELNYQGGGSERFFYKPAVSVDFYASRNTVITIKFQASNTILLGDVGIQGWGAGSNHTGTAPEKEVFNNFTLNLGAIQSTVITKAVVEVLQGTGTPVKTSYTLSVVHNSGASTATLAFDGLSKSPEFYPFKIKEVRCYSASGTLVTTVNCSDKEVTAAGAVTLP